MTEPGMKQNIAPKSNCKFYDLSINLCVLFYYHNQMSHVRHYMSVPYWIYIVLISTSGSG